MKKLLFSIAAIGMLLQTGCATLFGEHGLTSDQRDCQHHKPGMGEPKRKIRPAALVFDLLTVYAAPVWVGIDFLTGDIYKPCKVDIKYKTAVQKDTLPVQTLPDMVYDDKIVNIRFSLSSTSIDFTILNKANQSIKIDWNDVTIVQLGTTCRAVHNGVKLTNANESQPPSTIPSGATLDDGVTPSDNINWHEPASVNGTQYYAGGWVTSPLITLPEIRLYLPIQYQGKTIEYNITFKKIVNVTKP
jgi:hypothetical protein